MPGLVGLITAMPPAEAEDQLLRMLETLRHDSTYEIGTWADESLGVYVGWAALKGSFSAGMPLQNETRDVVMVFAGQEYSLPETKNQLRQRGHAFKSEGPSYLVHLYEEDPGFLAGLNGRFHGLLVDRKQRSAMLFNDRFGMQRLNYYESAEALYFAAEAKAILAVRPELRQIDGRALAEFVSCECVLEDRTLFKGIRYLPAASAWGFRKGSAPRKDTYFQTREWEEQGSLESESYYGEIRRNFSEKLPLYFHPGAPIGMSLTGGLDTRMVMAWQNSPAGMLPCYTFGGIYRECRDVVVARKVAAACRQPHQVITIGHDFLAQFPRYAERTIYLSDGSADVSRSPALYANEKAREIAPVRMTGIYGSEVLRRLRSFKPGSQTEGLFDSEFVKHLGLARETYAGLLNLHPVAFTVFRQTPQRGVDALEQSQVEVRFPFLDNEIVRTAFRAPNALAAKNDILADNDICLRLIADGNAALRRIPTDRGLGGTSSGFFPALWRSVLNFTFRAEYAYDYGMPQSVARVDHLISRLHPERLFLGRHKFAHFRVWYRDSLGKYVQEILLDPRTLSRPYLNRTTVEATVKAHLKGNRNHTTELHRLLSLELLHRLFVEGDAFPAGALPAALVDATAHNQA